MRDCLTTLTQLQASGELGVVVTVAYVAGSAPREPGAQMVVTTTDVLGTIGGGSLEFEAIKKARDCLDGKQAEQFIQLYGLGPMLEQCCGGAVFLHYERVDKTSGYVSVLSQCLEQGEAVVRVSRCHDKGPQDSADIFVTTEKVVGSVGDIALDNLATDCALKLLAKTKKSPSVLLQPLNNTRLSLPDISDVLFFQLLRPVDFHVSVFGAGHVATALVPLLASSMACQLKWIDSRAEQFSADIRERIPANVDVCHNDTPVAVVGQLDAGSHCLVMTHSHALDQALCEEILRRDSIPFLGLIGSATKRKRFLKRFKENGIHAQQLQKFCCPIGITAIKSKTPAAIAVSVVAQLLQLYEAQQEQIHPDKKAQAL